METTTSTNSLENNYINDLITNQSYSAVYLKHGIKLKGHLIWHNEECLLLRETREGQIQLIYKGRVSTIMPKLSFLNFSEERKVFRRAVH